MAKKNGKFTVRQFWYYTKRAIWILLVWSLISILLFFYEYKTLEVEGALTSAYDFKSAFTANLIVALSAGLIGGVFTVNVMEIWLRKYAFWKALSLIVVAYTIAALIISFLGANYISSENLDLPLTHPEVLEESLFFYGTWMFVKNFFLWLAIVIVTLIVLMVNQKYGPGVFPDYLMGRYFHPKHERRIFMFADIKDATTIAEALGEEKYFNFLKDFFRDIAPAITQTRGEVYQYVGDEVVVSWKMKHGLKGGNAVWCHFQMKKIIERKKRHYLNKYNCVPKFKSGFHFGNVMVGEIGQIKREIVFSGDVLNTAARIVAKCNDLDVDILASESFANVSFVLPERIIKKSMGEEKLKGKAEEIGLFTFIKA